MLTMVDTTTRALHHCPEHHPGHRKASPVVTWNLSQTMELISKIVSQTPGPESMGLKGCPIFPIPIRPVSLPAAGFCYKVGSAYAIVPMVSFGTPPPWQKHRHLCCI